MDNASPDAVRHLLRHLRDPLILGQSPWLQSDAVARHQQRHADATSAQALLSILDETLPTCCAGASGRGAW